MSRLWPERIALQIGPEALHLVRKGQEPIDVPLCASWSASFAALPETPRFARFHVTVADRHARHLHLAWPIGLNASERRAFTAHRFQAVFGAEGEEWRVLGDRDAVILPSLGAALPTALMVALHELTKARSQQLISLQTAFSADYNRVCRRLRGDGAFARLEAGRITVGLWRDSRWRMVRSVPVERADAAAAARCLGALLPVLSPEDVPPSGTLYLARTAGVQLALPDGWTCEDTEVGR